MLLLWTGAELAMPSFCRFFFRYMPNICLLFSGSSAYRLLVLPPPPVVVAVVALDSSERALLPLGDRGTARDPPPVDVFFGGGMRNSALGALRLCDADAASDSERVNPVELGRFGGSLIGLLDARPGVGWARSGAGGGGGGGGGGGAAGLPACGGSSSRTSATVEAAPWEPR